MTAVLKALRSLLIWSAAAAVLVPQAIRTAAAQPAAERPDILFISVDDLNDWIGPLGGHPQARTPNIDRLAARGLTFTNAQSPSSLCNPSRTAIMTGLRPSTTGVYGNGSDWRQLPQFAGVTTLPKFFLENGYETFGGGKLFHAHTFGGGEFAGFNDLEAWTDFYPYIGRQLPDEIKPPRVPANQNTVFSGFDWAPIVADDRATGDGQVVAYAERQIAADRNAPRFVAAGIYRPHLPWYVPQKYFDMHPLDEIVLPAVIENDLSDLPPISRKSTFLGHEAHEWVLETGNWKSGVQGYLASISFADAMVGRLLDALEASGRADNTIIVLWGDHGFHLGEKERWRKMTLWEDVTHVPFILVAPGRTIPGSRSSRPVSLMDIYPTLAELAGLEAPDYVEAQSLVPLIENPDAEWSTPAVTTYGYNNHAVRSERYHYIRYSDGTEELYDHENDPNEWHNLADKPELRRVKRELAKWLPKENAPDAG